MANILALNEQISDLVKQDKKKALSEITFLDNVHSSLPESSTQVKKTVMNAKNKIREKLKLTEVFSAQASILFAEYSKVLNDPVTHENAHNNQFLQMKNNILEKYLNCIRNLARNRNWVISIPLLKNGKQTTCFNCDNNNLALFETDENKRTCLLCSVQNTVVESSITHSDFNRLHIIGRFIYNRVLHFQECIKQYQGTQNCKIPDEIYKSLDEKFRAYKLLVENVDHENLRFIKYSKITRDHIFICLKELKQVKHWENVNLIYFNLTNRRFDDISHLELQLLEDFKQLVIKYDEIHGKDKPQELDRKNFMNIQYLLFQLLRRHDHPCKLKDFPTLKTIERKLFHDKVCKNLFDILGWKFTPTF